MVTTGFHTMPETKWLELSHKMNPKKILTPLRALLPYSCHPAEFPELAKWAQKSYIFAFPDKPGPSPWLACRFGHAEWLEMESDWMVCGFTNKLVTVRFDLAPEDLAFVVDRAFFADWQYGDNPDQHDAVMKYVNSRVPAACYTGDFRMPELIIGNGIPIERLSVYDVTEVDSSLYRNVNGD